MCAGALCSSGGWLNSVASWAANPSGGRHLVLCIHGLVGPSSRGSLSWGSCSVLGRESEEVPQAPRRQATSYVHIWPCGSITRVILESITHVPGPHDPHEDQCAQYEAQTVVQVYVSLQQQWRRVCVWVLGLPPRSVHTSAGLPFGSSTSPPYPPPPTPLQGRCRE